MRLGQSLKAVPYHVSAGLKGFLFGGNGTGYGGPWGWLNALLPGAQYDYRREAGNLWENSVVLAGLKWEGDTFVESPFTVSRREGDGFVMVEGHPLTALIQNPNEDWDEALFWMAWRLSMSLDGNCYWYINRSRAKKPVELHWVPHWQMEPRWGDGGKDYIGWYDYRVDGKTYPFAKQDIVHFRDGIDPRNTRKGLSKLGAVLREICTVNEAATFSASVMRNSGVPSVALIPADGQPDFPSGMDPETVGRRWMAKYGGDRRGEPFVSAFPMKVEKVGYNPEEMILDRVNDVPEARICAAMRIPAIVLGLKVGLDHSTYSNYEHALKAAYYHNVIPSQRIARSVIQRRLLPELGNPTTERVGFDTTDVEALQEDRNDRRNAAAILYKSGVSKRWEAKELAGLPFDDKDDDVYVTDLGDASGGQGSLASTVSLPDGGEKSIRALREAGIDIELLVALASKSAGRARGFQDEARARRAA